MVLRNVLSYKCSRLLVTSDLFLKKSDGFKSRSVSNYVVYVMRNSEIKHDYTERLSSADWRTFEVSRGTADNIDTFCLCVPASTDEWRRFGRQSAFVCWNRRYFDPEGNRTRVWLKLFLLCGAALRSNFPSENPVEDNDFPLRNCAGCHWSVFVTVGWIVNATGSVCGLNGSSGATERRTITIR